MSVSLVLLAGVLAAVSTHLILTRSTTRIVIGLAMLANAVNLVIVAVSGPAGDPPVIGEGSDTADPLPQAFVLTAIVISFALTAYLLALAWRSWTIDGRDAVEDDLEDRRLARGEIEGDQFGADPGDFAGADPAMAHFGADGGRAFFDELRRLDDEDGGS